MTFNFVFDLIIVFCVSGMIYILARVLPKIDDTSKDYLDVKTSKIILYLEKADESFRKISEKFIRKIKILVMRIDNNLSDKLSKFKKDNEKSEGFKFNLEENKEKEKENLSVDGEKGEDSM